MTGGLIPDYQGLSADAIAKGLRRLAVARRLGAARRTPPAGAGASAAAFGEGNGLYKLDLAAPCRGEMDQVSLDGMGNAAVGPTVQNWRPSKRDACSTVGRERSGIDGRRASKAADEPHRAPGFSPYDGTRQLAGLDESRRNLVARTIPVATGCSRRRTAL